MISINNGGLVKTFEAPFDKPILEGLFQCFHLYFLDLGFLLVYLNSATLLCKIIRYYCYLILKELFFLWFFSELVNLSRICILVAFQNYTYHSPSHLHLECSVNIILHTSSSCFLSIGSRFYLS